jgi:hypothetical protein
MGIKLSEAEAKRIMKNSGFKPLEPYKSGDTPWKCICLKCKQEVSPRLRQVRDRGYGCKFCAGRVVLESQAIKEMQLAKLKPLITFPGASKKWKSKCLDCGEIVSPRLSDIRMGHSGCKKCADRKGGSKRRLDQNPSRGGEQLRFSDVLEVMRKAGLEPLEPYQTSQTKWKCKCLTCGSIVSPKYTQIKQGGGGCRTCFLKRQPFIGRLDHARAVEVMRGKNLEPLEPYPGAMKPWRSKCLDCGTEIRPRYAHIQQGRKGCKVCGYRKNAATNRTPESTAVAIMQKAGFKPLEPYKHRHHPWKSECQKCGNIVAPHLGGIIGGQGCRFCSGLVVDPDKAREKMLAADLEPLVDYPGAGKPWKSKCTKCSRIVQPRYSQLAYGIGGCKFCASHGYDFTKAGILYLITHDELGAHKVGITNVDSKEKRLEKHLNQGWKVFKKRTFQDGNIAYEVEQAVLEWLRAELGLLVHLSRSQMPQGGWTETVDAAEVDLPLVWKKVEELAKNGGGKVLHF